MKFIVRKIKTVICNPWIILQKLLFVTSTLWSDKLFLEFSHFAYLHKWPNLEKPSLFSEKLQWLKLYDRRDEYCTMVDKAEVKHYVAKIIGDEYIIPTLKIYNNIDEIRLSELPNRFVLKTTHGGGSKGVFLCDNKNKCDWTVMERNLKQSMSQDSYNAYREWPYKRIAKRIIAEKYIEHDGDLVDYKFFCFNGHAEFCQVISGRNKKMCVDFFDKNWVHQDFHEPAEYPFSKEPLQRPINYNRMIYLAEKLARDIPFVRIDFYNIKGKILFGEITFFPTAGFGRFNPEDWNKKLGNMIKLPAVNDIGSDN